MINDPLYCEALLTQTSQKKLLTREQAQSRQNMAQFEVKNLHF